MLKIMRLVLTMDPLDILCIVCTQEEQDETRIFFKGTLNKRVHEVRSADMHAIRKDSLPEMPSSLKYIIWIKLC
jgi:hypothetical protein